MTSALIAGISGTRLTPAERSFFKDAQPAGLILFRRNVIFTDLIAPLIADVRDAVGREDFLVLIDQEGGRVQRLKPPAAHDLPAAAAFGSVYASDPGRASQVAFSIARLAAEELASYGINMNCAPVLDVPVPGAHAIIGDRAYGTNPAQVIALGSAVAHGLMAGGVAPVIKHIPGHGRATKDSHHDLPVVSTLHSELAATDFAPFKALNDLPAAMTAHVVFTDLDGLRPASTSERVTREIIRGEIGFDGLLMSDDVSMRALTGDFRARAEAVIRAGSDIALHCNGDLAEMQAVAAGVPQLGGRAKERFAKAVAVASACHDYDREEALGFLAEIMALRPHVA
jgi:beta-N-acetylhexosaminidase